MRARRDTSIIEVPRLSIALILTTMEAECTICLQPLPLNIIRTLPCGHCYCSPCLSEYNRVESNASRCCQCRQPVPVNLRNGIQLFVALNDPNAGKMQSQQGVETVKEKFQAEPSAEQVEAMMLEMDNIFKRLEEEEASIVCPLTIAVAMILTC